MAFLRKFPWSLLLAFALCLVAWSLKMLLENQIGSLTPFLLFFGAIMLATWNGGLLVGVFTTLISMALADYFFLEPLDSLTLSSSALVQCGLFTLEGFFIALATARARTAQEKFRAQVQRQSALAELSQLALARIDDADVVFERAVQLCAQTLDVSRAVIWKLERPASAETADYFQARAATSAPQGRGNAGAKASATRGDKRPADEDFAGTRALREGFPVAGAEGLASGNGELNAPLGPAEKRWGVLQIVADDRDLAGSARVWSGEQIEWVRAVAGVLGVTIAGQQARATAMQGETRYRSFVEQSSEAIWRFEMDEPVDMSLGRPLIVEQVLDNGFLAECNDALARMYGFERAEQMVGMRLWQLMGRDDPKALAFLSSLINEDFRVNQAESVERDHEGNAHVMLSSLIATVENGRLLRVWGMQRDVTSEREAERELKESENRFRSLFDAAPVPLGIGREQSVLYVNRALSELLGYDGPEELIGSDIINFVAPEERAQIAERAHNRAAGRSEPLIYQSRVQKRDGSVFSARVEMAQINLPEGAATLMFLFDLSAQERADNAIARLLEGAQDATSRAQNLQEISFDLLRARAPEETANVAIERVTQAVGARGGVLIAPNEIENPATLETIGARGYPAGTVDLFPSISVDSPHPMSHVYRTREPLWMENARDWVERFPSLNDTLPLTGTKAIAMLPLEVEGRIVSVMALSWGEPQVFNDELRLFLRTLANSCAQALDRARLDTRTRDLSRRQRESLALLNTLLDSAPVGFALLDREGRYVLVNAALAEINGQTIEQHIGKTVEEVTGERESEFERRLKQVWIDGRASGEFVLMDAHNGERRFCLTSLYPVRVERDSQEVSEILGVGAIVLEISERVRDEEEKSRLMGELETERARLEAVLQQMPSAVVIAEAPSGRMLLGNARVEPLVGRPVALDTIGDYGGYSAFWPDGRRLKASDWPLARAIEKGEIIKDEEVLIPDAAGSRVLRITATPIRDRDNRITAGVAIFDDVTQRARAEAAQRFLADAGSALIATLDASSAHVRLSRQCVPEVADWCILAVPSEDGLLRNASIAHIEGDGNAEAAHRFQQRLASDPNVPWDIAGVLSSGRAALYLSHDIEHLYRMNVSREYAQLITEIGARSAIVAPLEARGRTLGLMIWITSASGRVYDAQDVALAEELARRAALTTDNARLFREAQQARDQAEDANRAKDEFLAVVSHELRTPLTPILGWLDLLRAPGITDELRAQAYDVIERNARAQAQLVNDILDVSRITSGKLRLNLKPLDLTELVRKSVESLRLTADEHGVELRLQLAKVGQAEMDASRFQQVVWNLMSNAIKFTPKGGHIAISLRRNDSENAPLATLEIADSGQGIAPDFVPLMFEAFRQADSSSTRKAGGLGLGLAIVRHIVEMHGGRVSAHSPGPSLGATFRVQMPLLRAPQSDSMNAPAPNARAEISSAPRHLDASHAENNADGQNADGQVADGQVADGQNADGQNAPVDSAPLRNALILLVDDDPDTRETLARLLESHGARVRVASSAAEALQTLDVFMPQLAISDIGMPDVDGYQLLGQLRARLPELPAIALTAYAAPADIERAKSAGFQLHLAKPVEPSALINASRELLKTA